MTVTVCVPFRGGCEHREKAWAYIRKKYEAAGFDVAVGTCDGPWRKAVAVASAIESTDADVLVVADADVWCDRTRDAVREVESGESAWSIPHVLVKRLTSAATQRVLEGGTLGGNLEQPSYHGVMGGGVVVLSRDLWYRAPMDARFEGWGQEDEAWGLALRSVAGYPKPRYKGHLWHLWHPAPPRLSRGIGSTESLDLFRHWVRNTDLAIREAQHALKEVRHAAR